MLMSNTACTAMIIGAIMPLLNSLGKESGLGKAILLGVPVAAATGGMATIIGTAPNIIAAGALENSGIDITFSQWMLFGTPITLALTAVCCTVLLFRYVKSDEPVSLEFLKSTTVNRTHEMIIQRNIVIVILLVTVFMWLTSEWHGVSVAGVSAIPIVFLTLTGIVTGKDVRAIPWDTLFLVAGGMSLGVALQFNGILKYYAGTLVGLDLNQHLMLMILAFMTMTFANLMSHTATATVLVPLGIAVLPGAEIAAAVIIGLAASTAMLLPVSTPPNAIAFSTGLLRLKDFRLCGTLVGILGPLLIVLWILSCT
jgi:sodium-dependent dicarboxylate transporter 2/3/5